MITVSLNPAIDRILEVPDFAVGAHQRGRLLSRTPAGKGVNVSRALAALGVRSIATGFVGAPDLELFESSLDPVRVQSQFLVVDAATRENITIVDPVGHVETHIRDVGFTIGVADRLRLSKKLSLMCRPEGIVAFSGSVPEGISPAQFAEMIEICLAAGAKVAVDTSGPALQAAARLPLWLIKPNLAELREITGQPLETEADILAAGRELSAHIRTVIVTRGAEPGYCFVSGSALRGRVEVEPERVRNTVGAGDSLVAGFIAAQLRSDDIRESYRQALAVATASAVSLQPGAFAIEDVEDFLFRAIVEPVRPERPRAAQSR